MDETAPFRPSLGRCALLVSAALPCTAAARAQATAAITLPLLIRDHGDGL